MPEVLVTGAGGFVASRLEEMYPGCLAPSRSEFDILNPTSMSRYLVGKCPQVVVHCAAYTDVTAAEKQRGDKNGDCWQVNVEGTKNLLALGLRMIYISTDMVFAGDAGPYREDQVPEGDRTWYGFTKRIGEESMSSHDAILRIMCPVRSDDRYLRKLDFLHKFLKMYRDGSQLKLFSDQQISVTYVDEACIAIKKIIDMQLSGVFHATSRDTSTPYALVCGLLSRLGLDNSTVTNTSVDSVGNPVRYPKKGGLSVVHTQEVLGMQFSSCDQILDQLAQPQTAKL